MVTIMTEASLFFNMKTNYLALLCEISDIKQENTEKQDETCQNHIKQFPNQGKIVKISRKIWENMVKQLSKIAKLFSNTDEKCLK